MTYRDDLEAAHARIAALEDELASHRSQIDEAQREDVAQAGRRASMAEEIKQLRVIVEERRAELSEMRLERDCLSARVVALEKEQAEWRAGSGRLPTLYEHNRRFPPTAAGGTVEAACPACRELGIESQLTRTGEPRGAGVIAVACPSCMFAGLLREW